MAKLHRMSDGQYAFHCPGCQCSHGVYVDKPGPNRPVWGWNGSLDTPTFTPSVRVQWAFGDERKQACCHSYVRDGRIQFLIDSTHALAGRTVEIPDWEIA